MYMFLVRVHKVPLLFLSVEHESDRRLQAPNFIFVLRRSVTIRVFPRASQRIFKYVEKEIATEHDGLVKEVVQIVCGYFSPIVLNHISSGRPPDENNNAGDVVSEDNNQRN